jgi:hypothetical protein
MERFAAGALPLHVVSLPDLLARYGSGDYDCGLSYSQGCQAFIARAQRHGAGGIKQEVS